MFILTRICKRRLSLISQGSSLSTPFSCVHWTMTHPILVPLGFDMTDLKPLILKQWSSSSWFNHVSVKQIVDGGDSRWLESASGSTCCLRKDRTFKWKTVKYDLTFFQVSCGDYMSVSLPNFSAVFSSVRKRFSALHDCSSFCVAVIALTKAGTSARTISSASSLFRILL